MAIEDNPYVFRFEGRLWVSEEPRETAAAQLRAQREWDRQNARLQHWWVAISVSAVAGVAVTLYLGTSAGLAPAIYLVLLPIGFGAGAVLGALVNKRFFAPELQHGSLPPRPELAKLTRIPSRVARAAPDNASARDLIDWSTRGFVD